MQDYEAFHEAVEEDSSYASSLAKSLSLVLDEFYQNLRTVRTACDNGNLSQNRRRHSNAIIRIYQRMGHGLPPASASQGATLMLPCIPFPLLVGCLRWASTGLFSVSALAMLMRQPCACAAAVTAPAMVATSCIAVSRGIKPLL